MSSTRRPGRARVTWTLLLAALTASALAAPAAAQHAGHGQPEGWVGGHGAANYDAGTRWAPYKIDELVYSTTLSPNWIEETDRFWYEWETSDGSFYYIVDPAQGSKRQLFDNDRIAAELTRITGDPWDGQHLPIEDIRFIDENTLEFEVQSSQQEELEDMDEMEEDMEEEDRQRQRRDRKVHYFRYDVNTRTLTEIEDYQHPDDHPGWASVSPDTQWVVFAREFNLHMMSYDDYERILDARRGKSGDEAEEAEEEVEVDEIQLTTEGVRHFSYGPSYRGDTDQEQLENEPKRGRANITWSHDGRYFALTRDDEREVGDLWVIHNVGNRRPELETYKYAMAGEENVDQTQLEVFDMETREMRVLEEPDRWKDQRMGIFSEPNGGGGFFFFFGGGGGDEIPINKWLSPEPDQLYYWRRSRDQHRVDVRVLDPATMTLETVIEERLNTYVEHQTPRRLENGDLIWWSERDGWAHLYRISPEGDVVARLTEGPWHVSNVIGVNEETGHVFLNGNAREEGEDPYYNHVYRVGLNGGGLTLLNPGNFDNRAFMSESNRYFVNNASRVNTAPAATLHDAQGRQIMELEEADFSQLMAAGYQFPEPYQVKSADGVTDIYGVMYKPYDFDPDKIYPIIAYVYPGPQTESVDKYWSDAGTEQGIAQFNFIVVTMGNRGGHPDRSKWYHNYGYGDLRDYGLADKKAVIEQLADRHDFIDVDRVGIYGHSGGGFMSTAAMLVYPDFFKVAVSSAGNHSNQIYNANWSEKHHGIKEIENEEGEIVFEYAIEKNPDLAANLKGHLLLTTGDVDNNVHPAATYRMAEALIRKNKRFDFFLFPGQRHGFGDMSDYWHWLRAEYFVKHLLGDKSVWNADLIPLQREMQKTEGWADRARSSWTGQRGGN